MLGMLDYEQQSLEARKSMVTKMGYPMVGLGMNYSLIGKDPLAMAPDMNGKDMYYANGDGYFTHLPEEIQSDARRS